MLAWPPYVWISLNEPLTEKVTGMFQTMADLGNSEIDHSALILELERLNCMQQATESV